MTDSEQHVLIIDDEAPSRAELRAYERDQMVTSRMLMVILSVAAIAASGAGSSATGQLTLREKRTFELG